MYSFSNNNNDNVTTARFTVVETTTMTARNVTIIIITLHATRAAFGSDRVQSFLQRGVPASGSRVRARRRKPRRGNLLIGRSEWIPWCAVFLVFLAVICVRVRAFFSIFFGGFFFRSYLRRIPAFINGHSIIEALLYGIHQYFIFDCDTLTSSERIIVFIIFLFNNLL